MFSVPAGSLQFQSMGIKPAFNISIGNHLGKNTVGYLTYSTNWRVSEYNDVRLELLVKFNIVYFEKNHVTISL